MQPLPRDEFEYAEWHLARVGIDYHVEVQSFFYSVPHTLIREQVDTRATQRTIEVFHRGKRAVEIGALSYASVASILKHRLDRASPQAADGAPLPRGTAC